MRTDPRLLVFDTTHHALWAEELAREHRIPVEVVPAPPQSRAKCDLALCTLPPLLGRLEEVLRAEGVPYRLYP